MASPRPTAVWYGTDGHGQVRLMATQPTSESGYVKGSTNFLYRPAGSGTWSALSTVTDVNGLSRGFQPIGVDAAANVAYGLDANGNFTALYKKPLGGGDPTLVLSRDGTDIDGLLRIGRSQRIIGATYVTERREA